MPKKGKRSQPAKQRWSQFSLSDDINPQEERTHHQSCRNESIPGEPDADANENVTSADLDHVLDKGDVMYKKAREGFLKVSTWLLMSFLQRYLHAAMSIKFFSNHPDMADYLRLWLNL
ncbi:hypothetical protein Q8A73_003935 [Channa argus]|nr:hypothetical protein Q8A73_003935 [Channa argus]